jgi:EmrB/QacA subfamily drug resistance transporter
MISLDSLVVATALSTIHKDLDASLSSLEWTVNAYNLSFAVLLLTGAALGDRFGRKRMFIGGFGLFSLASVACALSPNVGTLIASRAIQGVGAAVVMPLALTQLSAAVPPQLRGKALGIFSGVTGLATFLGPFIGGSVSQGLAWQWIFWFNLPIGVIAILLATARIEESTGPHNRFDIGGVVLVTGGAFGLVWGLMRGNPEGWGSSEVLLSLIGGALLIVAFVLWEIRTKAPMLPMRFFKIRAFTTANVANFALFGSLYGTLFLLAQYLQNALGYGPFGAGLRLMPWTATLMVCAPIAGILADKLGERLLMVVGLLLNAIGMGWLSAVARSDSSYAGIILPLIVGGCGISMAMPAAQKSVVGAVKLQEIGQASGAITTLRIFGGVFGIAILTAVFTGSGGGFATSKAFADGFGPAMFAAAIVAFIGAVFGLGMPGRSRAASPVMAPPQSVPADQAASAR